MYNVNTQLFSKWFLIIKVNKVLKIIFMTYILFFFKCLENLYQLSV